ncbi:MAG: nodulation protein NfeD [Balneolales bacterium]|nr:nodulation protein NfeD [Balneolales bacterium]
MYAKQRKYFFTGSLLMLILFNAMLYFDEPQGEASDTTRVQSPQSGVIYVVQVEGLVDNGLHRYIERGIRQAEENEAVALVLHMDTFGGLVDAADKIRKNLLDTDIKTFTFIDKNAASAGALIAFATDIIYMAPGSSIGAATVVDGGGTEASEKMQSYMRGLMRATAEATGRNPRIAEAMVDERIVIEGITEEGVLVTLSTSEALEFEMIEGSARTMYEALASQGWEAMEVIYVQETANEMVLRFLANPVMSSMLMLMMLGGLYFELQSPGVGFPGMMASIGAILFFAPLYIMGFAEPWEIILFFVGVLFIVVEIFILPGFGIPGIIGVTLLFFSLVVSMIGNVGFSFPEMEYMSRAIWTMAVTLILGILMLFSLGKYLPQNRMFSKLILVESTSKEKGYTSSENKDILLGKEGVAVTALRPSGIALIDGERIDVVSQGDFVENGARVVVTNTSSSRVMVRRLTS